MKMYCAGPMRGYPEFNFPAFDAARDYLLSLGHEVISPADIDRSAGFAPEGLTEAEQFAIYMRRDIQALLEVDGIYFLEGWQNSKGARKEWEVGDALNLVMVFPGDHVPNASTLVEAGVS